MYDRLYCIVILQACAQIAGQQLCVGLGKVFLKNDQA
jgi:hypothetical protein